MLIHFCPINIDLTTHYCIKTAFVTTQKCISMVPVPINIDLTTHYCIKTAFVTTQKCISVVPVPINIDLTTHYCIKTAFVTTQKCICSNTLYIQWNLSDPTHQGTREMCWIVQDVGILRFYLMTHMWHSLPFSRSLQ
jgi:hypothetical protein